MSKRSSMKFDSCGPESGFSLMELVVVVAMISVIVAIATPAVVVWRNNLYYEQASRGFTTVLRQARSLSMSMNRQHYVVFKPYSSAAKGVYTYKLIRRSVDPTNTNFGNYSSVQQFGTNNAVTVMGSNSSMANIGITFNPNGTALLSYPGGATNDGNVGIYNGTTQKYLVTVSKTGRIASTHTGN